MGCVEIKDINKKVKEITETRDKLDGVSKNYRITAKDVKFKDIVIIRRNQRKKKIADMANDYITCLILNYEINCNQIIYMGEQVATEIKAKFNNNWTNLENIFFSKQNITSNFYQKWGGEDKFVEKVKKIFPNINKYKNLSDTIIDTIVNKNSKLWHDLCKSLESTAMESNFSVIKNLVIGGTLTEKDLLKDLNSNYISENVKKENKKFEKVVDQKEDIVSFLSELMN
ncbi:MAG: hypothetical protein IJC57_00955 [Clostridia bacterium]|nr:hypothetical protein [Clostridia bacterium]